MSRPVLTVELSGFGSLVSGWRARELCEQETGRPPLYVPRLRGYSVQERTARNVIARAEALGYDVVITGGRTRRERLLDALMAAPVPRLPDRESGLW